MGMVINYVFLTKSFAIIGKLWTVVKDVLLLLDGIFSCGFDGDGTHCVKEGNHVFSDLLNVSVHGISFNYHLVSGSLIR